MAVVLNNSLAQKLVYNCSMGKEIIKAGDIFNRWKVLRLSYVTQARKRYYLCRCECGTEQEIEGSSLRRGTSKSCGCYNAEVVTARSTRHGGNRRGQRIPEYGVWVSMRRRCANLNEKDYGGRGITVCERWQGADGFAYFLTDMGNRPSSEHTIERKDNNGNYEPDNCRWATRAEQNRNKRNNHRFEFNGKRLTLVEWAREIGIKRSTLSMRIYAWKWSVEKTLTTPLIRKR